MAPSIRGTIPSTFPYDLDSLYKFIPDFLKLISPDVALIEDYSTGIMKKPDLVLHVLNNIPKDVMNKFYESWSKREKKGNKVKIRWLSKLIDDKVFNTMHSAAIKFELPSSSHVHSYKKGVRTADCARLFVDMTCIVALDIKDFYYAITGSMVEELYNNFFVSQYGPKTTKYKLQIACVSKMLSILFMAKDIRPENVRYNDDTVLLQGTPHAGMIANAVLLSLDTHLYNYCADHGLMYARYSDNFYIASKSEMIPEDIVDQLINKIESYTIGGIANFKIKKEKIKVMPYYTHQRVLGIVVNEHLNISSYTEDIINAKISFYSNKFNGYYREFLSAEATTPSVFPMSRTTRNTMMVRLRKDLRELKGLVSYLGSFNRAKYDKYHEYISFLEQRAEMMYTLSKKSSSIYPYKRNNEEDTISLEVMRTLRSSDLPDGTVAYRMSRKHIIIDMRYRSIFDKFVSLFEHGFMGIEYSFGDIKLLFIPIDIASKYLVLADEIMIDSSDIMTGPLRECVGVNNTSPYLRCNRDIQKLNLPEYPVNARLSSIKIYNRENPEGFIDFENYQMHLRHLIRSDDNICIVKNNLDSPDTMYSNLWALRKGIIQKKVVLSEQ